ncbi:MAG: CBS domain-containing protein [Myxococcales bacterium]|nr:CBS domain-containing protein [Myxococcales bacterium]MCB9713576.1 CBS domain-containing protein [Myxococcales bacterium]
MGEHDVTEQSDDFSQRVFVKALLDDVNTLEEMLEKEMFETGIRRIGAEQEMFLVDRTMGPAPVAIELLEKTTDPRLTTELARFNLEANLTPHVFGGDCLRKLEKELHEVVDEARRAAAECDAEVLLVGILPTLRKAHLGLDNMCPIPRYHALNRAMTKLRGGDFHVVIKGLDELETTHDNVMLESCNTSFQIHFQVAPREFARLYNVAQAVTAPVLAAAVNSPVLLGRRLWNETRVALFQRSVDARSSHMQARGLRPRVSFGDSWVRESVLEIFREDIALFRAVLGQTDHTSSRAELAEGKVPKLQALRLHNGTVYRWNRACYGWAESGAHLRIENRVLPAGPSIVDEVANAAFYFGLMSGVTAEHEDISKVMDFDDAKTNFFAAARHGLGAQFHWIGGETITASALILDRLLPLAREGLRRSNIDEEDVARYLDVIEERVRSRSTGASWALRSLSAMAGNTSVDQRHRRITKAMLDHQQGDEAPVHTWETARVQSDDAWREDYRTVGQIMSTQLLTVRPEDLVDLAASMMDWERIRHVPVEDDEGRLVGIVSHRAILRLVARGQGMDREPVAVKDIMRSDPVSVTPTTPTLEAMTLMRDRAVGSLPVVEDGRLVGIVTEHDLIDVSARLLARFLADEA